ncbi:MAG: PKD domain-containing protein, partial [Phaeodactylibacter sp.]|nr:PKD domain-containing protein [Phaeodactylibacter sp.]
MRRFFLLFGMLAAAWTAQAQCPGCIVNIPAAFPADTIHLDLPPDGQVGVAYDEDISFRMPMSTTPVSVVDPDVPPGLNIDQIKITGFTGLPPGLEWEANQLVFQTGDGETDGCVKICGTPLQPDSFFMNVLVEVTVFGLPANSSFIIPIYIEPAVIQTDGFVMENNVGCGSTTVSFTNSIPSNGLDGYAYLWDFGNGVTSTDENPAPVTYNTPGTYEVNYTATIDTAQAILTSVTIQAAGCGDIAFPPNDAPDLYLTINKPNGELAFITPIQDNVTFPATFDLLIPLEPGNYTIEVTDDDLIGSQSCGTVTFNEDTNGLLFDGELQVTVSILNPLVTIASNGTVYVYEFPDAPVITGADGTNSFCSGDSLLLTASY